MLASCLTYALICIGLGYLPFTVTCMRLLVYLLVSLSSLWRNQTYAGPHVKLQTLMRNGQIAVVM